MSAIIGYGRVSSTGQSLEVQEEKLRAAGTTELFMEKRSGTTKQGREQLEAGEGQGGNRPSPQRGS